MKIGIVPAIDELEVNALGKYWWHISFVCDGLNLCGGIVSMTVQCHNHCIRIGQGDYESRAFRETQIPYPIAAVTIQSRLLRGPWVSCIRTSQDDKLSRLDAWSCNITVQDGFSQTPICDAWIRSMLPKQMGLASCLLFNNDARVILELNDTMCSNQESWFHVWVIRRLNMRGNHKHFTLERTISLRRVVGHVLQVQRCWFYG